MTTKRCLLFVGLVIAVAVMGLYAARATSAIASETSVKLDAPATILPAGPAAAVALPANGTPENLSSSEPDLTPVLDCTNPCLVGPGRCAKCCFPDMGTCNTGQCTCF